MNKYFPKPYEPFGGDNNAKVDLSYYATKNDIKNISHVDTLSFALKTNLASLKTEFDKLDVDKLKSLPNNWTNQKSKVDNLDIDKLIPVPVDLSKLRNVVKNDVLKKTEHNTKIKSVEDKIPDIRNLATKTILNTKINEVKNEIPSISNLATTSALTAVGNKIPSISNLVKKTDYNTKVKEIENKLTHHKHDKYITTPEFNKLTAENSAARLKQANLITKTDFHNKLTSLNRKLTSNKIKHLVFENELKKLKTFNLSYFKGKSHFDEDGAQNYLVFEPILKYFTLNSKWITKWKWKGLSNESLKVVSTSDNTLTPSINYYGDTVRLKFTGRVLQQKTVTYSHKKSCKSLCSLRNN